MAPLTSLFLVRHGEVAVPYHRVFGGRIDMSLSETGLDQARKLADHLRPTPFDAIYASPMLRARQTLEAIVRRRYP